MAGFDLLPYMAATTSDSSNNKPSGRGGPRPGSGRKPGKMEAATIRRMKVLEAYKRKVEKAASILFTKQMELAQGTSYLYRIETDEKGRRSKPELVTSRITIERYLMEDIDDTAEYFFIHTERPDNKAIDSMLDRAFGKATQPISGDPDGAPLEIKMVSYADDSDPS